MLETEFTQAKTRVPYYLRKVKGIQEIIPTVFIDSETTPQKTRRGEQIHDFRLAVTCFCLIDYNTTEFNEEYKNFTSIKSLHKYLLQLNRKYPSLRIIAHNMTFDSVVCQLLDMCDDSGYSIGIFNPKSTNFVVSYSKKDKRIILLDSLNFFKGTLEHLGKEIGVRKKKMPEFQANNKAWLLYCKNDVKVIVEAYRFLHDFLRLNQFPSIKYTLASQAFAIYRKEYYQENIKIHVHRPSVHLEVNGMFGGRVECFKVGKLPKQDYFLLDVNSLYPYIMATKKLPIRLNGYCKNPSIQQLEKLQKKYQIIARVKVRISKPFLPLRTKNALLFPIGTFWTVLTSPEIELLQKYGEILEIKDLSYYMNDFVFKDFIKKFSLMKEKYQKTNKQIFRYFCKIMMNSLYGKFGQKTPILIDTKMEGLEKYAINDFYSHITKEYETMKTINYKMYIEKKNIISPHSSFAISAHITAFARVHLWNLILEAGEKNVFYCDTDSLILNSVGYKNLKKYIHNTKIGKLALEKVSNRVIINSPKFYEFGKDIKSKGIPRSAKKITPDSFQYMQFPTIISTWKSKEKKRVVVKKMIKNVNRKNTKRFSLNNYDTFPWTLNEK